MPFIDRSSNQNDRRHTMGNLTYKKAQQVRLGGNDQVGTSSSAGGKFADDAYNTTAMVNREKHLGSTHSEHKGKFKRKYEYPIDNKDEYSARIIFKVIKKDNKSTVGAIRNLLDQAVDLEKRVSESSSTENKDDRGGPAGFSVAEDVSKQKVDKDRLTALYGNVKSATAFSEAHLKTKDEIKLYLPRGIQVNDQVEYDTGFQLGMIGGITEQAMNDGGGVLASLAGAALGTGVGAAKAFMGGSGLSAGAADILAQKVASNFGATGQAISGGIKTASQITTNPNTRAIFKDVPLRSFGFNFSLIPTSEREAREIEDIVKVFRTELYPTTLVAGGIRVGYEFPNQFLIKVKHSNNQDVNLRFLPVYLQSFNATYNANSPLMHVDGKFNQVDIAMQFTETRALTKADVRDGGY